METPQLLEGLPPRIQALLLSKFSRYFGVLPDPDAPPPQPIGFPRPRPTAPTWTEAERQWLERERERLTRLKLNAGLILWWDWLSDRSDTVLSVGIAIVLARDSGAAETDPRMIEIGLAALAEYESAAADDPPPTPAAAERRGLDAPA